MALCLGVVACEFPITRATERAWQESFADVLIEGYTDFKGLDVDADTGFYVFSYSLPVSCEAATVIPALRDQIASRKPCFSKVFETSIELQMRCGIRSDGAGFDEYRVLVNPAIRKVTAMFGNFDSAAELRRYEFFVSDFRKAHGRR